MKKQIIFNPAFDRRSDDPSKNYGVHGVEIRFVLRDYRGAVQFLLYTNWIPFKKNVGMDWFYAIEDKDIGDSMKVELKFNPFLPSFLRKPLPADLGYHSPKSMNESSAKTESCELLGGKPCYYDGSTLNAIRPFIELINGGEKGVWDFLKKYHEETFGKPPLDRFFDKVTSLYNITLGIIMKKRRIYMERAMIKAQ